MALTDRFSVTCKVAVVTGASSGWGVAFAKSLAEAGADVALGARRADRLADTVQLARAQGRRPMEVQTDVSRRPDCLALVDAAMAEFGRVDVLVNNAGIGTGSPQRGRLSSSSSPGSA